MGNNTNLCGDKRLMGSLKSHQLDFNSERPLFNAEDITYPLSTQAIKIVDARGKRVKLAGGNWSGAHMCRHCVDGLQCRPLRDIAMDIRYKFKMNCIRLTYSLQLFFQNKPIPSKYLTANPELIGKTGLQIFDITIQVLTEVGLMVILNNHNSTSQWCCSDDDGDGLWWSRQFPECMFFQCAEAFAQRYKDNPRVIGMDLRNQLRKAHGMDATWGDGNPLTDWKRAAKICSQKVHSIAPHWLILVSGLSYQLDLTRVKDSPLQLSVPNKLIYTGHFYGFSWLKPNLTAWKLMTYEAFKQKLFNDQTYVRGLGHPYFLGEFGNNNRDTPWKYLIRYLKETDIDWTYWSLDGFKCQPKEDETYGVFTNDFSEARHPDMLEDMISVGPPAGTIIVPPRPQLRQPQLKELIQQSDNQKPRYIQPQKIQISQQGRFIQTQPQPQQPRLLSPRNQQSYRALSPNSQIYSSNQPIQNRSELRPVGQYPGNTVNSPSNTNNYSGNTRNIAPTVNFSSYPQQNRGPQGASKNRF